MPKEFEHCPTCGKELKGVRDYPVILIKDVQRLTVPDYVESFPGRNENIRETIVKITEAFVVEKYLSTLEAAKGTEINLSNVESQIIKDDYFKNHFRMDDYYVGLWESEKPGVTELAVAKVFNMGAAGGPQLKKLVAIAKIQYEGRFYNSFIPGRLSRGH